MLIKVDVAFLFLSWIVTTVTGARILALFPYIGKSHFVMFDPYIKELASRGHQVVVVSHFPQQTPIQNLTDISLVGSIDIEPVNRVDIKLITGFEYAKTILKELDQLSDACNKTLSFHAVQELWKSKQSFDLIIAEAFNSDCILPFVHRFKAPLIGISTCVPFTWVDYRMGNPKNPSYAPSTNAWFSDRMTFFDRLINTLFDSLMLLGHTVTERLVTQQFVYQNFGEDVPLLSDLARNTSLILINSHFSLNRPRPLLPSIVEVGGLHIKPPKKVPKDLEDYLNGAEHGVICFSFGSMIRTQTLPPEKRDAFLQAFSELPQKVIWKWEGDAIPGLPNNVKIVKWLPQFDVLNHHNIRAYMTHGGLLGTIEAAYAGVPMVAIPMFGDQYLNVAAMTASKMGVSLFYKDINKQNVLSALRTVLEEPSYKENAKRMSRIYQDRPLSPMETAIYWTEYVIRHKGAPHLRSAALDLAWYQYLLLDVFAVLAIAISTIFVTIFYIVRKTFSYFCRRKVVKQKLN